MTMQPLHAQADPTRHNHRNQSIMDICMAACGHHPSLGLASAVARTARRGSTAPRTERHPRRAAAHVRPQQRRWGARATAISAAGAQGNASGSASGRGARRRPEGDAKLIDNGSWKGGGGGRKSQGLVDGFCIICGSIPLSKR